MLNLEYPSKIGGPEIMRKITPCPATRCTTTRREFLVSSGAIAMTASTFAFASSARASATHTLKHGNHEITVLSDGHLSLPRSMVARGGTEAETEAALKAAGQTGDRLISPTNVTLIRSGGELIMVDAGAGKNFMDTAGKLPASLQAAGVDPTKVTKVVYTHAHPDHIWGTLDDLDEANFPNAAHWIAEAEWNFWMGADVLSKLPEDRHAFAAGAKRQLSGVKDKIKTFKPGADIAPGIRAIDTSGHTQGHISLEIVAGKDALIVLGDALTHPVISFAHPQWRPASDHEPDRAIATRTKLLDRVVADKSRVIGYHLPFPGLGMVEKSAGAYRYVPAGG